MLTDKAFLTENVMVLGNWCVISRTLVLSDSDKWSQFEVDSFLATENWIWKFKNTWSSQLQKAHDIPQVSSSSSGAKQHTDFRTAQHNWDL